MEMQPDFRELLALFNARHVEYLIVGGYALAFHGAPRFTGDLDIFVKPETANAQGILAALEAFGFASAGLTPNDFERPDQVVNVALSKRHTTYCQKRVGGSVLCSSWPAAVCS
jgi:hypothetical protein